MKKKIAFTVIAGILALAMTGCSFTTTVTKTETVTDANGRTTTTSSVTTNENGKVSKTESVEVVEPTTEADASILATLAFDNETGMDFVAMYFSDAQSDDWGENILREDDPFRNGDKITFRNNFRYNPDTMLWDLKLADGEGTTLEFKGLDLSRAADPENILVQMVHNEETDGYTAYIE